MNMYGCSHQLDATSIMDFEERRNGGAVREERSPLVLARVCVYHISFGA